MKLLVKALVSYGESLWIIPTMPVLAMRGGPDVPGLTESPSISSRDFVSGLSLEIAPGLTGTDPLSPLPTNPDMVPGVCLSDPATQLRAHCKPGGAATLSTAKSPSCVPSTSAL